MSIKIAKRWSFDAAHRLPSLPATHKCHRLHGHTYAAELVIEGEMRAGMMIIDYDDLDAIWLAEVHARIDHRVLNDVDGLRDPTTEALAAWILDRMGKAIASTGRRLAAVRVYESSSTWAEATA